jgi:cation transport regulator ChaC
LLAGLVVTLLEHERVQALPRIDDHFIPGDTTGMAYVVPSAERERVLAELDFREKGGYVRKVPPRTSPAIAAREESASTGSQVVTIDSLHGDVPGLGTPRARALVYSATVENPNFWWGDDGDGWDLSRAAEIISTSVGPSGPNIEYFENLYRFLRSVGRLDPHLESLNEKLSSSARPAEGKASSHTS